MVEAVNKEQFQKEVLESPIPVLVDFYANWCGPCRALVPLMKEVNSEANGQYKVVKVDCDSEPELASEYKINALPTLILFKNGSAVKKTQGAMPKPAIISFITE